MRTYGTTVSEYLKLIVLQIHHITGTECSLILIYIKDTDLTDRCTSTCFISKPKIKTFLIRTSADVIKKHIIKGSRRLFRCTYFETTILWNCFTNIKYSTSSLSAVFQCKGVSLASALVGTHHRPWAGIQFNDLYIFFWLPFILRHTYSPFTSWLLACIFVSHWLFISHYKAHMYAFTN